MRSWRNKYLNCHENKICNCSITEYCILVPLLGLTIKNILIKFFFFNGGNDHFKKTFVCLWLHWVFVCAPTFCSCSSWSLLFVLLCGLLITVASVEHGLYTTGFSSSANRLSCFLACGVFLDQGSNLCPLHWQAKFLSTVPPWKSEMVFFLKKIIKQRCQS